MVVLYIKGLNIFVYVIVWLVVAFGINSEIMSNACRKIVTERCRAEYYHTLHTYLHSEHY